jgi:hypothetical protein
MTSYIDAHKDQFGVEPICQALEVAPSTYYAATSRPTSARRLRDEELKVEIARVHEENLGVYGVEKVWRQLHREGVRVGRDRVLIEIFEFDQGRSAKLTRRSTGARRILLACRGPVSGGRPPPVRAVRAAR